jgi:hypothetical protein
VNQAAPAQGIGRFTKYMILGALVSGVVCSVPILNCANFFFCFMNMGGILLAMWLYFKASPDDTLTTNESMLFGAIAGAGAGLVVGILSVMSMAIVSLTSFIVGIIGYWRIIGLVAPPAKAGSVFMIPVWVVLYAGFGLLASFLGMKIFFKTRLR